MNDSEIIQKLKKWEEEGLRQLIRQYNRYVTAILCNISRGYLSLEDIEELAADVFLAIWNHSYSLQAERPIKPYLAQTTRNAAYSRLRKVKDLPVAYDDDILSLSPAGAPDELTIQREQTEILNSAVEAFGEPDREIFIRFYYLGEHIEAIGRRLAINSSTVKTRLHRCRKRLRGVFEERGYQHG